MSIMSYYIQFPFLLAKWIYIYIKYGCAFQLVSDMTSPYMWDITSCSSPKSKHIPILNLLHATLRQFNIANS
jgi:hypothetical protein